MWTPHRLSWPWCRSWKAEVLKHLHDLRSWEWTRPTDASIIKTWPTCKIAAERRCRKVESDEDPLNCRPHPGAVNNPYRQGGMLTDWNRWFPDSEPVAHHLRAKFPDRWIR